MFNLFKSDPTKKLKKLYAIKLEEAMHAQRNGDIRTYAKLSFEADALDTKIVQLETNNKP